MSGKNSKLLRKIAKLSGHDDKYVKREYRKMSPFMQKSYLDFVKKKISQVEEKKSSEEK